MFQFWMLCLLIFVSDSSARYLPTRSQEDRLDKLRELIRELIESEVQRSNECGCALNGPSNNQLQMDVNAVQPASARGLLRDLGVADRRRGGYFKRDTKAVLNAH